MSDDPDRFMMMRGRVDGRTLIDTNPEARAIVDMVAACYLRGTLTVAELRVLFTLGLEKGMMLEPMPKHYRKNDSGRGEDGG